MNERRGNDSAFPSFAEINGKEVVGQDGITIREWYASQAMQGILANSDLPDLFRSGFAPSKMAEICFECAEAMLTEGRKRKHPDPKK